MVLKKSAYGDENPYPTTNLSEQLILVLKKMELSRRKCRLFSDIVSFKQLGQLGLQFWLQRMGRNRTLITWNLYNLREKNIAVGKKHTKLLSFHARPPKMFYNKILGTYDAKDEPTWHSFEYRASELSVNNEYNSYLTVKWEQFELVELLLS